MQPIPAHRTPSTRVDPRCTVRDLELRCRILEIERRSALLMAEEFRKLLEEQCISQAAAAEYAF